MSPSAPNSRARNPNGAHVVAAPVPPARRQATTRVQVDSWNSAVVHRLHLIAGRLTYKEIGARTSTHPESVRRYFTYGHPSVEFIAAFCRAYSTSADWLLNGFGNPGRSALAESRGQLGARVL